MDKHSLTDALPYGPGGPLSTGSPDQRRFHVMVKPAGCSCNLKCTYCFYLHKAELLGGSAAGRMPDETLERFISQYIGSMKADEVTFSWQGGEPMLLGVDYFRRVLELQKQHARPGQTIQNDIQTNGTLMTEEWCDFLKANQFLVGLSIDGPKNLHDRCRIAKDGRSTFDQVCHAAKLLKRYGIPFNTLTCITRYNARFPLDVYRFLRREIGSTYLQFIPIVEYKGFERTAPQKWKDAVLPLDGQPEARPGYSDSVVTDWSVDPDDWGYFLSKTFDEWRNRDLGKAFVNHFETLVAQHMGLPSQICIYSRICGRNVALERDGSVYACDHYVYPEYGLGNMMSGEIGEMVYSSGQVDFGLAKSADLPGQCRQCLFLNDCWGECPKNRIIRTASGEPGLNYLCRGFKQYFAHAIPEVDRIVRDLRKHPATVRSRM